MGRVAAGAGLEAGRRGARAAILEAVVATWDPEVYRQFAGERTRPARELLARVEHAGPREVVDLGCGTGELARVLAERWPQARVRGVDLSAEMLAQAAAEPGRVEWVRGDIATWRPEGRVDVIVSNAALHWVPGHEELLPDLLEHLAPGGVLAFQIPDNVMEPSHVLLREVLASGGPGGHAFGNEALLREVSRAWVLAPEVYIELLAPHTQELDVWRTVYYHRLTGEDAVLEWVRGTLLRPVLEALKGEEQGLLLEAYVTRLREAYPAGRDGRTEYRFPRLFVVARR